MSLNETNWTDSDDEYAGFSEWVTVADEKMIEAVLNGQHQELKGMLETGVDPNDKTEEGLTALMLAAIHGKTKCLKVLLKNGASVDLYSGSAHNDLSRGKTALMFAAEAGKTKSLNALLSNGANIEANDRFGGSPILYEEVRSVDRTRRVKEELIARVWHPSGQMFAYYCNVDDEC